MVLQRVKVGDRERVGDDGAGGRATSRPDDDAEFSRIDDVVLHDEEVAGEAHGLDHVQLVVQSLLYLIGELLAIALLSSLVREVPEVVVSVGKALRDREVRHQWVTVDGVDLHLVEDLRGIAQRLGHVREDRTHLLCALEPLLLGIGKPIGVVEGLAGAEADQSLMSLSVILMCEVGVIGGNELHTLFPCELHQYLVDFLLLYKGLLIASWLSGLVSL